MSNRQLLAHENMVVAFIKLDSRLQSQNQFLYFIQRFTQIYKNSCSDFEFFFFLLLYSYKNQIYLNSVFDSVCISIQLVVCLHNFEIIPWIVQAVKVFLFRFKIYEKLFMENLKIKLCVIIF